MARTVSERSSIQTEKSIQKSERSRITACVFCFNSSLWQEVPELIGKMAEMTVRMVIESVDAFVKKDLKLCRKVIDDDDQVDDAFNQVKEELATLMYQNLDAKAGLDLLMTAKYMERIGDHAVNIAEWVEYAITGNHRNNEHQMGGNQA